MVDATPSGPPGSSKLSWVPQVANSREPRAAWVVTVCLRAPPRQSHSTVCPRLIVVSASFPLPPVLLPQSTNPIVKGAPQGAAKSPTLTNLSAAWAKEVPRITPRPSPMSPIKANLSYLLLLINIFSPPSRSGILRFSLILGQNSAYYIRLTNLCQSQKNVWE